MSLALAILALITLLGCANESTETAVAPPVPPPVQDQTAAQPLQDGQASTPRLSGDAQLMLVYQWIECFEGINDILDEVTDVESAERMQPALEELVATKFKQVRQLASRVSPPGPELAEDQDFNAAMQRFAGEQQRYFGHLTRTNQIAGIDGIRKSLASIGRMMTGQDEPSGS
jgi:hypothetical protein